MKLGWGAAHYIIDRTLEGIGELAAGIVRVEGIALWGSGVEADRDKP